VTCLTLLPLAKEREKHHRRDSLIFVASLFVQNENFRKKAKSVDKNSH
jgi:hypothetical protein